MGLQKFRADTQGQTQSDGSVPYYTVWMGGPSLALIRDCNTPFGKRTVYITNHPDTFFSIPAACIHKKKRVRGYVYSDQHGEYKFRVQS